MKAKILFFIAAMATLVSCEDVLDTKTTFNFGPEDTWRIPQYAEGVLMKAYSGISARPDSYSSNFLDCATDNAVTNDHNSSLFTATQGGITEFSNPVGNWDECYKMLQSINDFMAHGLGEETNYNVTEPEMDAQIKQRLTGEAHFLRAWWHFELLKVYGGKATDGSAMGIILAKEFVNQDQAADYENINRATYQESVDFIIEDLNKAASLLPDVYAGADINLGASHIGRASRIAALVLKSRVLLYSASPAYQSDNITKINAMGDFTVVDQPAYEAKWGQVADSISVILSEMGVYTAMKATDIADASATACPVDFVFRKHSNVKTIEQAHFPPFYNGNANTTPSHNLVKAFSDKSGYPYGHPSGDWRYDNLDSRFELNVYHHGATFGNSGVALDMVEGGKDAPSYHVDCTKSGYYLAKFVSEKSAMLDLITSSNARHNKPLLRKSEVFFNYAEAAFEAWGTTGVSAVDGAVALSSLDVIKDIRKKSGDIATDLYIDEAAADKDKFRSLIQNERRLEFAFEDQRYFDMRRCLLPLNEDVYGVEVTLDTAGAPVFTEKMIQERKFEVRNYYAPLPYGELVKNSNIVNNQGW